MATTNQVSADVIAQRFSELVRDQPAAKRLCYRQRGPVSEFWLLTDTDDLTIERQLRSAGRQLYKLFPGSLIDFQVINAALSSSDPSTRVPSDADSYVLH